MEAFSKEVVVMDVHCVGLDSKRDLFHLLGAKYYSYDSFISLILMKANMSLVAESCLFYRFLSLALSDICYTLYIKSAII